jgi:broad specificity phosphatase PhoE
MQKVEAVMPALLVSVRHGQTDTSDLTAANHKLPLTRTGLLQARRAGTWITHHLVGSKVMPATEFDRAYFSPYTRARQTMGGIAMETPIRCVPTSEARLAAAEDILAMVPDLRLRELYFGDASRMSREEMRRAFPATFANRDVDTLLGRTPNGDAVADGYDRIRSFLGRLARGKARGEEYVLAVDHGRTTRSLQLALMGIDAKNWEAFDRDPANEIDYTSRVLFARRDPVTGKEYATYHWTATVHMTPDNDQSPRWQEFEAPVGISIADCLEGVPAEWLQDPLV